MNNKKIIACLGDSMTQFWGHDMNELNDSLTEAFHELKFELHNYGVSGTRAEYGKYRIIHDFPDPFSNGMKRCLSSLSPDLIIVESHAYNHRYDGHNFIQNYKNTLRELVRNIKEYTPAEVYFLVTIPPDKKNFLGNVATYKDVNCSLRMEWAESSDRYLKAAIEFANSEDIPLVNVYDRVQREVVNGTPLQWFIDQNDNIHPSRYTYKITAEEIIKTIKKYQLWDQSMI